MAAKKIAKPPGRRRTKTFAPDRYEGWSAETFAAYVNRLRLALDRKLEMVAFTLDRDGAEGERGRAALLQMENAVRAFSPWEPVREARMRVLQSLDDVVAFPTRMIQTTRPVTDAGRTVLGTLCPGYNEWRAFVFAEAPSTMGLDLRKQVAIRAQSGERQDSVHTTAPDLETLGRFLHFVLMARTETAPFTPSVAAAGFSELLAQCLVAWSKPPRRGSGSRYDVCDTLLRRMGIVGQGCDADSLKAEWSEWKRVNGLGTIRGKS